MHKNTAIEQSNKQPIPSSTTGLLMALTKRTKKKRRPISQPHTTNQPRKNTKKVPQKKDSERKKNE